MHAFNVLAFTKGYILVPLDFRCHFNGFHYIGKVAAISLRTLIAFKTVSFLSYLGD